MNCIFCGNESEKKWHLDCLDVAVEEEFGADAYNFLLAQSVAMQKGTMPFWIERLISEGVDEGRRNIMRFKLVCFLNVLDIPFAEIRKRVWEFNKNCRPPERDREVDYHLRYLERYFRREDG